MIPYSYPHTICSYHPPTKLWEGNVYTGVCQSFCSAGIPMWPLFMMHWTSLYRPPSLTLTPDIRPSPTQLVTLVTITGDLFKLVHLRNPTLVLTSGGRSMYDRKVGGTRPPRILSSCSRLSPLFFHCYHCWRFIFVLYWQRFAIFRQMTMSTIGTDDRKVLVVS